MNKKIPTPIPASTVILTRQTGQEFEIYLIRRHIKSGFMGGLFAFPGGKLDPGDFQLEDWEKHLDESPKDIQARLGWGLDVRETVAFGIAAIRETFEEVGVFLAHGDSPGKEAAGKIDRSRRLRGEPRGGFMDQVCLEPRLLDFTSLLKWSHWITPELMKYRFDTRFFMVCMPEGQVCRPDSREAVQGIWVNPERALQANLLGDIPLTPPTLVTLQQLLEYQHLDDLLNSTVNRDWGKTILPRMVKLENGTLILEPWDSMYHEDEIKLDEGLLEQDVLRPGVAFSRIWFNGELWRPIRTRRPSAGNFYR